MSHARTPLTRLLACLAGVAMLSAGAADASAKRSLPVLKVVPKPAHGAVTRTIGTRGGTLHVKTRNGTTIALAIPANALQKDTSVTLTPLAAVKRAPFKHGIVAAVRLAPEGLTLLHPAKLTFRPRKHVPLSLQTPFSASGRGASFHIYPGRSGRAQLVMPLFHFSVYGEGEATPGERANESGRAQSDAQSRTERDLAEAKSAEAIARALDPDVDHVAQLVKHARTDDVVAIDALDEALSLAEELRLYGWSSEELPPHMGDEIPKSVDPALRARLEAGLKQINAYFPDTILDNALAKAAERCVSNHQPVQAERILSIEELRRFLGATDQVDLEPVKKCLTFELDIDSEFHTTDQRLQTEVHAQTKIPLHVTPDLSTWTGTGPVTYQSISEPYESTCTVTATGSGAWDVFGMLVVPGRIDTAGRVLAPMQPGSVIVDPPRASEQYDVTCPGSDTFHGESLWLNEEWRAAHADELYMGAFSKLGNWSPGSGDLFGTKTYSRTFQDHSETWSESTTLQLRHTPEG